MILYSNGDEHCAASYAVVDYAMADEDRNFFLKGKTPHPSNAKESYSQHLGNILKCKVIIEGRFESTNQRIIDSTNAFLDRSIEQPIVLIGWSTWERETWNFENEEYNILTSRRDKLPIPLRPQFKEFNENLDWKKLQENWHDRIWDFHCSLNKRGIRHLFFNTYQSFNLVNTERDWGDCFIEPYDESQTFWHYLNNQGYKTKATEKRPNYCFGADAHLAWAKKLTSFVGKIL